MPRFYLHIHDVFGFAPDEEGRDLPTLEHARDEAVKGARSLLSEEVAGGKLDLRGRIDVTDDRGGVVEVVQFGEVVEILTGQLPASDGGTR